MSELMIMSNPKKRRKKRRSTKRKTVSKRRRNPVARTSSRKRRRKNPDGMKNIVNTTIMPAAIAASGAFGLDVLYGFIPIPANIKAGPLKHVVKAAGAIGLGMVAGMMVRKSTAKQLTTGALTVVMHDAMKETAQRFMPNLALSAYMEDDSLINGLGYVGPGYVVGDEEDLTMDAYMGDDNGVYETGLGMEEEYEDVEEVDFI